ncbi:hypothetical protein [Nostoc sp.]
MNYKIILASLLILSVSHLPAAASCPEGNPKSIDYELLRSQYTSPKL